MLKIVTLFLAHLVYDNLYEIKINIFLREEVRKRTGSMKGHEVTRSNIA